MIIFKLLEVSAIVAILVLAYLVVNRDIEGDWVDIKTGEHFVVRENSTGFNVKSNTRTFSMVVSFGVVICPDDQGDYNRWSGTITWKNTKWARFTDSANRHDLNWITLRNYLTSAKIPGTWYGRNAADEPIFAELKLDGATLQATLRVNGVVETATGVLKSDKATLTTTLNDTLEWSYHHQHTATLKINNEFVTLNKLDLS